MLVMIVPSGEGQYACWRRSYCAVMSRYGMAGFLGESGAEQQPEAPTHHDVTAATVASS